MTSLNYQKKTVLQVIPALNSGGAEYSTVELSKYLAKQNFHSMVASSGGNLCSNLELEGVTHLKMGLNSKNPYKIWRNSILLNSLCNEYNIDIIHANSRAPAWSAYLAAKNRSTKFIATFHGIYGGTTYCKKYYNSVITKGDLVIAVSHFVKNHILENYKVEKEKIRVVYQGVDAEIFSKKNLTGEILEKFRNKYGIKNSIPVILLPARMSRLKGHKLVIKALLAIKDLDFHCLMVGDLLSHPKYLEEIRNLIYKHNMQDKISLFSTEPDMVGLYGISDIVLSYSLSPESFGRTVIEAQAMEKLVISNDIGGVRETVKNEVTGFQVSHGNIAELASKLRFLLMNLSSEQLNQIRHNARRSVKKLFTLENTLKKTLEVYNELT